MSRPLVCGNYLQTLKPLSVYTRPEHLCRPLGCHGLPWKMVLATPLALFQVLSCALVLIMWLWGNFLRVECGTPGPNSSRLAGRHWSPQRKSPVLQGTQCGQEVTPPTWVSDPCSVSLLSEGPPEAPAPQSAVPEDPAPLRRCGPGTQCSWQREGRLGHTDEI